MIFRYYFLFQLVMYCAIESHALVRHIGRTFNAACAISLKKKLNIHPIPVISSYSLALHKVKLSVTPPHDPETIALFNMLLYGTKTDLSTAKVESSLSPAKEATAAHSIASYVCEKQTEFLQLKSKIEQLTNEQIKDRLRELGHPNFVKTIEWMFKLPTFILKATIKQCEGQIEGWIGQLKTLEEAYLFCSLREKDGGQTFEDFIQTIPTLKNLFEAKKNQFLQSTLKSMSL